MNRIHIIIFFLFTFFCPVILSQNQATPRSGEGIYALLKRYNRTAPDDYNKFMSLNKGKFGKDNSLKKGVTYRLPPLLKSNESIENNGVKQEKRINKLYGKKYEEYTISSNRLKGACFYLSSGHGGPDSGAVGNINGHQICEDEYAYDITLRLARCLQEEGATVHIIIQDVADGIRDATYLVSNKRETCMGQAIPLNQLARLKQRSKKINELDKKAEEQYKRAIFIHLDSRSKKKQLDVFFYYAPKSKDGKQLAKTMRKTFDSHYIKHQPGRGFSGTVDSRDLYVLENTIPVGLFAELGNIQNSFDQQRFLLYDNRQALANWMCRGLIKNYEDNKKR